MFPTDASWRTWNTRYAEKEAMTASFDTGYKYGAVFGNNTLAHRAAFAIHHGYWPTAEVDHINGVKDDNRAENLRDVGRVENSRNCALSSKNTSGVIGVWWNAGKGKWEARVKVNYKPVFLGRFDSFDDAVRARKEAEVVFGFHQNHSRPKPTESLSIQPGKPKDSKRLTG
jgi:hypothetical protein